VRRALVTRISPVLACALALFAAWGDDGGPLTEPRGASPCRPGPHSFGPGNWPPACWRPYGDTSPFNQPLPSAPELAPDSSATVAYITGLGPPVKLRANDHGTPGDFGEPIYWSRPTDPVFTVACDESRGGACDLPNGTQARIPDAAQPAGGSDGHLAVIDPSSGWEYDFWRVRSKPEGGGTLVVDGVGRTRLDGDGLGSGATAAKFGNYAGTIRPEELAAGRIDHALVAYVDCSDGEYVYPAMGSGRACDGPDAPPMGTRLQLDMTKAEIDGLGGPPWKKAILEAMARYGIFVSDTGGETWGLRVQSDATYESFGRRPRLVEFAQAAGWPAFDDPALGRQVRVGDFGSDVRWRDRLRVIAPCVSQRTC